MTSNLAATPECQVPAGSPAFCDDFLPATSWEILRARARLLGRLRQFFAERDFVEVETPLLSADTVIDRHLDPPETIGPFRVEPGGSAAVRLLDYPQSQPPARIWRVERAGEAVGPPWRVVPSGAKGAAGPTPVETAPSDRGHRCRPCPRLCPEGRP